MYGSCADRYDLLYIMTYYKKMGISFEEFITSTTDGLENSHRESFLLDIWDNILDYV